MTPQLVSVVMFLTGQLGVAIWWASRVSSQLDNLSTDVRETRAEVGKLRDEVQHHDTAIAVIRAVNKATNGVHT
jgi:hypothetical protein